ncbi:nucleoside phosphorylase [Rapidithrix thailandica]|uniref:Uridine phosphorylase n=1 Tax=Rapidithrix thailandica TaxID=413964 RepID=A0AAW9RQQ7_9BACT
MQFRKLNPGKKKPPIEFKETDLILNNDGSVYHLNLLPEHISDTIITVGDPGRVYRISHYFDNIEFEINRREFVTHTGTYKGKRITAMSTGMGTDNVEIVLNELDALANINLKTRRRKSKHTRLRIIRVGTSGAIREDIRLNSHLVSNYAIGFDTLMYFYKLTQNETENRISDSLQATLSLPFRPYCVQGSEELKDILGFDMVEGNTVTLPGFYAPQMRNLRAEIAFPSLIEDLNYFHECDAWITNFEMETAGYYALGRILGHDVISLNAIIANRISNKFSKSPNKTIDALIRKVLDRV